MLITLLGLLFAGAPAARQSWAASGPQVHHVVVVWMAPAHRNQAAIDELIGGHELLRDIPGLVSLSVGRSISSERPIVDDSFDVAAVFRFESHAALQAYLQHPLHQAFLERHTTGKVDRIVVYDF
jgi:antibiotic biosynthesis monooxygenase (ABM) superfamily enzyme